MEQTTLNLSLTVLVHYRSLLKKRSGTHFEQGRPIFIQPTPEIELLGVHLYDLDHRTCYLLGSFSQSNRLDFARRYYRALV